MTRRVPATSTSSKSRATVPDAGYQRVFCTCRVCVWLRPSESVVVYVSVTQ